MDFIKKFFKDFIELLRVYALSVTIASCIVILSFAHYSLNFTWFNYILLVFALICVHLGANLFDDVIDVKKQLSQGKSLDEVKFYSYFPKARLILDRSYDFKTLYIILGVLFLIPSLIGLYFTLFAGWQVLLFAFFGGVLTLFYPFSSKYYLSELTIGLIYGPLMINGGYYALCGEFNSNLFLFSMAIFFTCLVLLHTDNIMDWEFDLEANKKTLALLTKDKNKAINILKGLIVTSYAIIALGVFNLNFNPYMLLVFLTLPISTKLIESMKDYININDVQFNPRWYYGLFENWEKIKEAKCEFYMYRIYLARNFGLLFAIFASIGVVK